MGAPELQSRITQYFQKLQRHPDSLTGGEPSRSTSGHSVKSALVTLEDAIQFCQSLPTPSPSPPRSRRPLCSLSSNVRFSPAKAAEESALVPNVPAAYMFPGQAGHHMQQGFKENGPHGSCRRFDKPPTRLKRKSMHDAKCDQLPFTQQRPRPTKRACRPPSAKALAPYVHSNSPPSNPLTLTPHQNDTGTSTSTNMELCWTLPGIGFIRPMIGADPAAPIDLTQDDESVALLLPVPPSFPVKFPPVPSAVATVVPTAVPTSASQGRGRRTKVNPIFRSALKHSRGGSDDCVILTSHKHLGVFKAHHFKELNIQKELSSALQTGIRFDTKQLKTIILSQYLKQPALTGRDAALGGRKKSKGISSGHPGRFPGIVEMQEPIAAVKQAYEEHTFTKIDQSRLVLWTDASESRGGLGFAVVYRDTTSPKSWAEWTTNGFSAHGKYRGVNVLLESIAVVKACEIAIRKATASPGQYKSVSIYSDSLAFLQEVARCHEGKKPSKNLLVPKLIRMANKIKKQHKIQISLHWVPGHSQVPGNELADKIAGIAAGHKAHHGAKETIELSDGEGDEWESDDEEEGQGLIVT